nr:MAG TPA_asm: hypothetical protein [Caudoviricetes sp.]
MDIRRHALRFILRNLVIWRFSNTKNLSLLR